MSGRRYTLTDLIALAAKLVKPLTDAFAVEFGRPVRTAPSPAPVQALREPEVPAAEPVPAPASADPQPPELIAFYARLDARTDAARPAAPAVVTNREPAAPEVVPPALYVRTPNGKGWRYRLATERDAGPRFARTPAGKRVRYAPAL